MSVHVILLLRKSLIASHLFRREGRGPDDFALLYRSFLGTKDVVFKVVV